MLLDDELFMSVPLDDGELVESFVCPLEPVVPPVGFDVELPTLPLELPLTEPLPVCVESTGPSVPLEPEVPADVSVPVEGAAGRAVSLPLDEVEPAVSPLEEVEPLLEVESWVVVLELEVLWSLERSRGEVLSLELPREGSAELRPWALRRLFEELLLESLFLLWSSDLLRSLFWPWAVALESADVWPFGPELVVMDWSELEDELPLFILALSDLLSEVLLELGVELELVSWLCARAPGAASARARTDSAMNLIDASTWGCLV